MRRIRMWFFRQAIKDKNVWSLVADAITIEAQKRTEAIAYHNWVSLLNKYGGFPKNNDGSEMDCWQLYDYYLKKSGKRDIYLQHAKTHDAISVRQESGTSNKTIRDPYRN